MKRTRLSATLVRGPKLRAGEQITATVLSVQEDGACSLLVETSERIVETTSEGSSIEDVEPQKSTAPRKVTPSKTRTPTKALASPAKRSPAKTPAKFKIGDAVEATFNTRYDYYPGVITQIPEDDKYGVQFADGDFKVKPGKSIRLADAKERKGIKRKVAELEKGKKPADTSELSDDEKVEPQPQKRAKKSIEPTASPSKAKPSPQAKPSPSQAKASLQAKDPPKPKTTAYKVGQKVEAAWKFNWDYFPGTIKAANKDGTYDIQFNDGDFKSSQRADRIRPVQQTKVAKTPTRKEIKKKAKESITEILV